MNKLLFVGPLLREFFTFARENKVFWIVPLVLVLLVLGFVIAAGQVSAPFIYTLF